MINIILCGGSGSRLWPISRTLMPKQFVKLFKDKSLFQETVSRNNSVCEKNLIVSNTEQYFLAVDQLSELNIKNNEFLLEPIGRNTAPAIALACFSLDENDLVLVTPSDHLIKDLVSYNNIIKQAEKYALLGNIVTFGITPTYPETEFGYIEANGFDANKFHEKPDMEKAQIYLERGNYYWNSGMFCFKAGVFLEELKKHSPRVYEASIKAYSNAKNDGMIRIQHDDMANIPDDSIDYAVMEKSNNVKVIPSDISWSDVGSFDSLYSELEKDEYGNTLSENSYHLDSTNNLILSNDRIITTIDVNDLIVVDTPDALLISKKGNSQKIKEVVKYIKSTKSDLDRIHVTAHRPWGTYTILEESEKYKIKRIVVKPGKRLSLQKHYHRNEHWIVVSGSAIVTVGENEFFVKPNESTYIPMGEVHRLENPGKLDLILIEAQVGDYLGEDDIVRLEDDFKRN